MISIFIFLIITFQVLNEEYDIIKEENNYFFSLSKYTTYSFYMEAEKGNDLKVHLSMDICKEPFNYLDIKEYASRNDSSIYYRNHYVDNLEQNGDKTLYSVDYSVTDIFTNYIAVEFYTFDNIQNFNILISVSGVSKTVYIILTTVLPIFCCCSICIIIFIICKKRENKPQIPNRINQINISHEPLYNNPPVQYAPPQNQNVPIQPQGNQIYMPPGQQYQ